jgi:phosphoribosylanthranilate isomerase
LFKIKICGIKTVKDAQLVALAGADAIGLNFYDKSPRCVDQETSAKIVAAGPARVAKVGLFVNAAADEVNKLSEELQLDWIQLHGDESPEFLSELVDRPVLRAIRLGDDNHSEVADYVRACCDVRPLGAILVDKLKDGAFGGTGETIDWADFAGKKGILGDCPLVLAGGLTPFNVEEAIAVLRPSAVDVASGVESQPGTKDLLMVRAFTTAAKRAFAAIDDAS